MEVAGAKKALQRLSGYRLKNIFGCVAVIGVAVVAGKDEWGGGKGCQRWWWLVWPDAVVAGGGAVNDGGGWCSRMRWLPEEVVGVVAGGVRDHPCNLGKPQGPSM
ncbi:hypothetical protein E3N88_26580 [Mikania micrantha]|uniref:Uncharacterized protein n=1 Tax=Mikania micrantha TaxID=192012 RepID=A0A5N6MU69_9ASTR|nr:hypothetical protein E3N88_26580 [Mikania micrantha]